MPAESADGAPGLIVAAPASGAGKTLLTLGLLAHMRANGPHARGFKVGPDYIDPGFHARASGHPCPNLDPWAMRRESIRHAYARLSKGAEIILGEGVMGLYDGARDGTGSTADLAALLGLPVLLVLDVRGQAASAAATALGFQRYRDEVTFAGVVCNRVGGAGHEAMLRRALDEAAIPCFGCLPRDDGLELPSRHLGLVQADEREDLDRFLARAAAWVGDRLDVEAIVRAARGPGGIAASEPSPPLPPLGQRIAVARDAAFAFAYDAVLAGWRRGGAEILPFSPLGDEAPAGDADAVYLPGGYPELYADRLAAAGSFLDGLAAAAGRGAAIYGECGGFMVLGRGLVDAKGRRHRMAGLLPVETSFAAPELHLGYRRIALLEDGPLGSRGTAYRGHEFHYARLVGNDGGAALFRAADAEGRGEVDVGCRVGRVMGSYLHLIDSASAPDVAPRARPSALP